ncbi:MAG: MFS transporter [Acidimicrobiales bacterium]
MTRGRYRMVFRAPGVAWLLSTSLLARLPVAMANLAIILRVVGATGSYAGAGAVTGIFVISSAITGPPLGRLADRVGRRPVLLVTSALNAAGFVLLAVVPVRDTLAVLVLAGIAGACLPPVAPAVRSLWQKLVSGELRASLYAFDATMQETTFMVGPSLVALLSTLAGPSAALIACGVVGVTGTAALALHPALAGGFIGHHSVVASGTTDSALSPGRDDAGPRRSGPERGRFRPAGLPGLGALVVIMVLFLAAILVVEVAVVAFAGRAHEGSQAGLLLAVWAAGSMAGGLVFGARAAHGGGRVLAPLIVAAGAGFLSLAAAPDLDVLYVLLFVAGMSIAPGFSCIYGLVGEIAPSTSSVEAFSWIGSGIQTGAAAGAALGGVVVETLGTRSAFVLAACGAVATAVIARQRSARRARPG